MIKPPVRSSNCPEQDNSIVDVVGELYLSRTGKQLVSPKQIGRLVRDVRREQGLRQDQLAATAGVGVRFLVELEHGKRTAQLGKVLAVLDALGCTLRIEPPPSLDDLQAR